MEAFSTFVVILSRLFLKHAGMVSERGTLKPERLGGLFPDTCNIVERSPILNGLPVTDPKTTRLTAQHAVRFTLRTPDDETAESLRATLIAGHLGAISQCDRFPGENAERIMSGCSITKA